MSKTVPVTLPERTWGRLATEADERGMTVGALMSWAIMVELEHHSAPRHTHRIEPDKANMNALVLREELKAARANGWRAADVKKKGLS